MIKTQMVDGVSIAYWTNDQDPQPGRRAVLFVPGSGADHTAWEQQYTILQDKINIFALDLPGHGASDGKGEQDVTSYVEWIRKFIEAKALKKPVLVGHSLGAAICLSFAIRYGDLLAAIVPLSGGVRMPVNPMIIDGYRKDPVATMNLTWKFSVSKQNREKLARGFEKNLTNLKPEISIGDFLACDKFDITDEISKIKVPSLIMCGAEDKMTPVANGRFMQECIAGSRIAVLENAGHLGMLENPEDFNAYLVEFLSELNGN